MTPERWRQISRVYQSVLEQAPAARDAFVATACRDDSDLRREVESLLSRDDAHLLVDQPVDRTAKAMMAFSGNAPMARVQWNASPRRRRMRRTFPNRSPRTANTYSSRNRRAGYTPCSCCR